MSTAQPAVRRRLRAGICVAFLFLAVVAGILHHQLVSRNNTLTHHQAIENLGLALAKGMLDDNVADPVVYSGICKRIMTNSPDVIAVRMWSRKNEILGEAGLQIGGLDHLARPLDPEDSNRSFAERTCTSIPSGHRVSRIDVAVPGLPGVRSRCHLAMAVIAGVQPWTAMFWSFVGWYGGACLLIAAAAWVAIHRSVFMPLEALAGLHDERVEQDSTSSLANRHDEWGAIARSLRAIRREMMEWREHANRTERRLESRLASQTREILRDLKRFQREAWVDALTGVKNRRLLEEKLPEVFAAQRSAGQDLTIAMIDLDNFKKLNDTHGHQAGDTVLKFAGELLRQCLRSHDIAVRYGGDEFVLILPGLSAKEAFALVRRISALFTQRAKMMAQIEIPVGFTTGIASLDNNDPRTPAELLACADHALYQAKKSGRGRARICEPSHRMPV